MRYFYKIFFLFMLCIYMFACASDTPKVPTSDAQKDDLIATALRAVQDSMKLDAATFQRLNDIVIKYEHQTAEIQQQQFNNPKSKQQVIQNLMKSRRAELGDVLKPKEVMTFNKLYKQSLNKERKRKREEKQLNKEDRKALTQKIQAYRKASVMPVILEQRKALEAAMSPTDKTQIAGLREKMKTFNQSMRNKKADCEAIDPKNRKAKMACRREIRDFQKTYEPIKKEMEEFVTVLEGKSNTKATMVAMETQRNQWRIDLKNILDEYSEQEIDVDKVPLNKYFRMTAAPIFLMLDPANVNVPESDAQ